jgi:tRNA-2-methylthio-N6-dimethylallyladenosine synthase
MNEYDSNRILDMAKGIGYELTKEISEADCYILNTCHIREKATEKVYHDVGRVKKEFRDKKKPILLVTGCVAQAEGEDMLKREKYIDGVVGPQSYHKMLTVIQNIEKNRKKINLTEFEVIDKFDKLNQTKNTSQKISSFLTIQEGCDKFCKFCVVPYTRGPEQSRPFSEILTEANQLIQNGSKEITLLGQNVNAYNYKGKKLSHLIYALNTFKDLKRIRYTTSHPKDVTDDLIKAHADCEKLMPLLHLPVQSGSTKILKQMNRKHDLKDYLDIIEKLKDKKKTIKFSSDFIIGYPGEKKKDFQETIFLMKKIKFINSYSFVYSPRPGTPAAELESLSSDISKKRLSDFQKISNDIKKEYRKSLINTKVKVLFENKVKDEFKYFGRDEYSNSVIVRSEKNLVGKIFNIRINKFNQNTLFGEISEDDKQTNYAA